MNSSQGTPTILLIEDDEGVRESMREALQLEGYRVEAVSDGQEGLDRLNRGPLPALVLLDLMLPRISGWEFIEIVRSNLSAPIAKVPIVITSAAGENAVITSQLVDGHLNKPIDLENLLATVSKYFPAEAPK